jgi:toxin ParE1/3/4
MRLVVWAADARADLDRAIKYIAATNPPAARRVSEKILQAVQGLAHLATGHPGRVADTYERLVAGLPYIIAYGLDREPDGSERVLILRSIHAARDWPEGSWPH